MKKLKAFFSLSIIVLYIVSFSTIAYAIPMVRLELSASDISAGDSFEVNVIADGVTEFDPSWGADEVLAFGFDVDYTASEFTYNGATVGSSFFDDSLFLSDTDVAGSAFPGVSGDGILLASLSFISLAEGTFSLGITSDLYDPNEGLITWFYPQLDITNSINGDVASTPVPEPGTIFLVGIGIAGFGLVHRVPRTFVRKYTLSTFS